MVDWKTIGWRLLTPPVWLMIVLAFLSAAGLTAIFVAGWEQTAIAYFAYVLSAYTLTVWTVYFVKVFPGHYRNAKAKFYAHPYGRMYMTDVGYKVRVSLYLSLGINLVYSAFHLVIGAINGSLWMITVAVYYVLLSALRFTLLRYMRADKDNSERDLLAEFKKYRFTGILMLFINLMLSASVLHMMVADKGAASSEIMTIASATFTFYTVTMSVVDIVRYRQYERPVISAAKALRFAASLVSLLSLEITMLQTYGTEGNFLRIMPAVTGAAVCAVIVSMAVYMIVRATKEIHKRK